MFVEIYGVPEDIAKCAGCIDSIRFCIENGYEYELIPVLSKSNNSLGFDYILEKFDEIKTRANLPYRPTSFPRIFVDGRYIGSLKQLRDLYGDH
ncbi:glutaredoxin [Aeromonas phage AS-szw]|uniref:Glutaredoxin n=1 Tax=Aeromonas phage AS-szw TaxID=2026114 RepID=A0A291LDK5_9CAUD|nr:glutaredoxin [Aeromonas phage AS-szw]